MAECLVHLNLSSKPYFPVWREAFADARDRQLFSDGPFKMDFWGRMLFWTLEPPPKFRFSAPRNFQPGDIGAPEQVLASFLKTQEDTSAALAAAKGLVKLRGDRCSPAPPSLAS